MQSMSEAQVLAVFEAFLAYARSAGAPPKPSVYPLADDSEEGPTDIRIQNAGPTPSRDDAARDDDDEPVSDSEVTKITRIPEATVPTAPQGSEWDGPTTDDHSPEVLAEVLPDTDHNISTPEAKGAKAAKAPRVEERSIIVDDDSLTDPEFGRDAIQEVARALRDVPAAPVLSVEQFLTEMNVLIKYGHGEQVQREAVRWLETHPEDPRVVALLRSGRR